ncbi:MAG: AbrB/MazE/SpoVT family DNA-binding domain-containing protein [Candidatus Heimdallarchaeota archaeon]|nr:AbrB/MazE/SpoVT family DNA-binding domain-containing protein [Candidatus Heimdallarchaeota archaeon]
MTIELRIGSKGELFLPKKLREDLNLKSGDTIYLETTEDGFFIKKIKSLLELLDEPKFGILESANDIEKDLEDFQFKQVKISNGED